MKTQMLKHGKWWLLTAILAIALMAVSLSFCAWDNLSINALIANADTGEYYDTVALNDHVTLVVDNDGNKLADVGDIVTFGEYYQDNASAKTPLRWIVVEKQGTILTLLTEKVVAFGSFWGTRYYDGLSWTWGTQANGSYYQNYEKSTIRAWLNSTATRNDGGPQISGSGTFVGFYKKAFTAEQQAYIIPQNILGMRGTGKDTSTKEPYAEINADKVWIPSYTQVYGDNVPNFSGNDCSDGSQNPTTNSKFSYFNDNTKRVGKTTAFASSSVSNYTWNGATHNANMQSTTAAGSAVWWWLRSPLPSYYTSSLVVDTDGSGKGANTNNSGGGVRPAVCVQL